MGNPYILEANKNISTPQYLVRGRGTGWAGWAITHPGFGRSVNPISTRGARLCPSNNTGTPEFSDLPTALYLEVCLFDFIARKLKKLIQKVIPTNNFTVNLFLCTK